MNAVRYRRRMKFATTWTITYRPGTGEKSAGGRGIQPLQTLRNGDTSNGVELGKSNILLTVRPVPVKRCWLKRWRACWTPVHHGRRNHADRSRLCGRRRENIIQKLLQKCDYDVQKAQPGLSTSMKSTRFLVSQTTRPYPRRFR